MPCQQFPKGQPPANSKGGPFDTEAECLEKLGTKDGCPCCANNDCKAPKTNCCSGVCINSNVDPIWVCCPGWENFGCTISSGFHQLDYPCPGPDAVDENDRSGTCTSMIRQGCWDIPEIKQSLEGQIAAGVYPVDIMGPSIAYPCAECNPQSTFGQGSCEAGKICCFGQCIVDTGSGC
jgi:hypothetical protein